MKCIRMIMEDGSKGPVLRVPNDTAYWAVHKCKDDTYKYVPKHEWKKQERKS